MASLHKTFASGAAAKRRKPPGKKHEQSAWMDYKRALVRVDDLSQALESIAGYIGGCWEREHAQDYEIARTQRADLSGRYNASCKTLAKLEAKETNTQRHIASANVYGKPSKDGALQWSRKDIALVCVTLTGAIIAMALGGVNVFANLKGAQLPIFLESPWLAVTLSFLLPVGSLAIKFMAGMFEYDRSRRIFAQVIYSLTLVLVLVWSWLFANSFASVTGGGIDLDALLSGSDHGPMLVWTQLLVEMMAGSALFLAAESISAKYSPQVSCDNPEYLDVKAALEAHRPAHIALRDESARVEGRIAAMDAQRETLINQHVADFLAYRERFNAVNDPNY